MTHWGHFTWDEIKEYLKKCNIVLLPVGSCEQHSLHLPLDTDSFDALWLCEKVVERVKEPKPLILPPINYGVSYHHLDFAGTISISPDTLKNMVIEIAECLKKHGVSKMIIVNGHGGNKAALTCASQIIRHKLNMLVIVDSGEIVKEEIAEEKEDFHAGEKETSTSLYNREELVRKEKIKNPDFRYPKEILRFSTGINWNFKTKDVTDTGAMGYPEKATKEKGKKLWEAHINALAKLIEEIREIEIK